jgi:hypothetical protein
LLQICSENGAKQWKFHCKRVPSSDEISFPTGNSGKKKKKKKKDMLVTLGDKSPSYSTVKICVARFRTGHLRPEGKHILEDEVK